MSMLTSACDYDICSQRGSSCLRSLSSLADGYVNDAFGTCHRAHASTAGVPAILDSKLCGVGYLVASEVAYLDFSSLEPGETVAASKFLSISKELDILERKKFDSLLTFALVLCYSHWWIQGVYEASRHQGTVEPSRQTCARRRTCLYVC